MVLTFVKRNTWLNNTIVPHGWGNGYVALSPGHPFHGMPYEEIDAHVSVHGGLTFSDNGSSCLWPEFDSMTLHDWWVIGFDTCHHGDNMTNWSDVNVIAETRYLADQLSEIENASKEIFFRLGLKKMII